MSTIQQQLSETQRQLAEITSESAQESRLILSHLLKISPSELINNYDQPATKELKEKVQAIIKQRLIGKPLQYILKEAWFYDYPFYVDERVLIPRPETEFVVEKALDFLLRAERGGVEKVKHPKSGTLTNPAFDFASLRSGQKTVIADVGTGCGCIAITLAKEIKSLKFKVQNFGQMSVYATDISKDALTVARRNSKRLLIPVLSEVEEKQGDVHFLFGSLLDPLPEPANIIITNLPYIPSARISKLQTEVKDWEPRVALDGGEDGFQLYRQLFSQLKSKWQSPGLFIAEIDYTHRHFALELFNQYLPQAEAEIIIDPIHKQLFLQATIA